MIEQFVLYVVLLETRGTVLASAVFVLFLMDMDPSVPSICC